MDFGLNSPEFFWGVMAMTLQLLRMLWFIWLPYLVLFLLFRGVLWYRNRHLSRSGIADTDRMSGEEFEVYLETLFRKLGYTVRRTPYQGDYGADLIVRKGDEETVVQAKRYNRQVGVKAVQEAVAAKELYRCNKAMVVTNSRFTHQAQTLAKANHVELWDRNELGKRLLALEEKVLASTAPAMAAAETATAPTAKAAHTCALCGRAVTTRVSDYCLTNRDTFGGQVYCFEHQKDVRKAQYQRNSLGV